MLIVGSPARAAPGWLPPQDVSAPSSYPQSQQLALNAAGDAVAVWSGFVGGHATIQGAFRPAGGTWAPQNVSGLGQSAVFPSVALDAAGNAIAVWSRSNGTNTIVQASVRPAGGSWQAAEDLSAPGQDASDAHVAMNAAGEAIAVWRRSNGGDPIVQASVRPPGGSWGPPVDLSATGSASNPKVALNAAGDAAVVWFAWDGSSLVNLVHGAARPAGEPWQAAQTLSATGGSAMNPKVVVDAGGNVIAIWTRSNGTRDIVQAASRPAGGSWQPAQDLSTPDQNAFDPQVAVGPGGDAIAVWDQYTGTPGGFVIRAARRPLGGPWQLPGEDLSAHGLTGHPHVAIDEAGRAVAVWNIFEGTYGPSPVGAWATKSSFRGPGGPWQAEQPVSPVGQNTGPPQVAMDGSGNALAVWRLVSDDGLSDMIRASAYDATAPELRNVGVPARGFARQRLTFSVEPFDTWSPLGPPVWNFGDGKRASGRTVKHTYARRGSYTVTVTQADAVANSTSASRLLTLRTARCFGAAATRVGSSRPDYILGTRRADVIVALGGADRVRGRGGNDRICGGPGRDRLAGGAGNDLLNGGPGRDICSQGRGRGRLVAC